MQDLVNKGFYTPEEAKKNVKSNVITRAVGVETSVAPDVQEIDARPGDLFLLCSDGLTDMVEDADILTRLQEHADNLTTASESLVELANKNGGRDNISVVLARVVEPFPEGLRQFPWPWQALRGPRKPQQHEVGHPRTPTR